MVRGIAPPEIRSPRDRPAGSRRRASPREKCGVKLSDDFGSKEDIGLVGAPVDGRTAKLGEPDRLGLRRPAVGVPLSTPPGRLECGFDHQTRRSL